MAADAVLEQLLGSSSRCSADRFFFSSSRIICAAPDEDIFDSSLISLSILESDVASFSLLSSPSAQSPFSDFLRNRTSLTKMFTYNYHFHVIEFVWMLTRGQQGGHVIHV